METAYLIHELSNISKSGLTPIENSNSTGKSQDPNKMISTSGMLGGPKSVQKDAHETTNGNGKNNTQGKGLHPASTAGKGDGNEPTSIDHKKPEKKLQPKEKVELLMDECSDYEMIEQIRHAVSSLISKENYVSDSVTINETIASLELLYGIVVLSNPARKEQKTKYIDETAEAGIVSLLKKVMEQTFELPFNNSEFILTYRIMYWTLVILWNGTDCSEKLSEKAFQNKLYVDLFRFLDHKIFLPENIHNNKKATSLVKGFMGILNNIMQMCDVRYAYRQCDGVRIIEKFIHSKNDMVKCKAFMVLSYIINEEENGKLNSDDSLFKFLLKILDDSLKSDNHRSSSYGYRSEEIIEALNRLAANDANKGIIVRNGAIKYYTQLMGTHNSTKEQALAARGIWILAYTERESLLNSSGCIEALKNLAQNTENESVSSEAKSALWILEEKNQVTPGEVISKDKASDNETPHVMISYQWDNQKTMLKIRDELQAAGFKVWMDVDKMSGFVLDAMAEAVERAAVVIVAMSQKYKESPNCRAEGDYAFKRRKQIVPLKLQYRYDPDGWLGMLIGSMLYFDFSREDRFVKKLDELIKELGDRGKIGGPQVVTASKAPNDQAIPPAIMAPKPEYSKWNTQKVASWLEEHNLKDLVKSFSSIDGGLLNEFRLMHRDAPEFFYKTLETSLNLTLPEMLKFTKALRTL